MVAKDAAGYAGEGLLQRESQGRLFRILLFLLRLWNGNMRKIDVNLNTDQ